MEDNNKNHELAINEPMSKELVINEPVSKELTKQKHDIIIHRNVEQKSAEWFKLRENRITASEALTISVNGKGLDTYIYKIMAKKYQKNEEEEKYLGKDVDRGVKLEDQAALIYSLETGRKIEKIGFVEYNDYVGCSPDLFAGNDGLCEIKCPNNDNFYRILMTNEVKKEYIYQCHMQMIICGKKWCDLLNYNPNFAPDLPSYHITIIEHDDKITKKLLSGFKKGEKLIKKLTKKSEGMKLIKNGESIKLIGKNDIVKLIENNEGMKL